jgi:hypothetical protein
MGRLTCGTCATRRFGTKFLFELEIGLTALGDFEEDASDSKFLT